MKHLVKCLSAIVLVLVNHPVGFCIEVPVLNLTQYQDESSINAYQDKLVTVKLRGKVNHAGPPGIQPYHAVVPDVHVWLAEHPASKQLNVTSDETGWWTMHLLKHKGMDLKVSFIYAKEGWVTTKTNVLKITDVDDTDLAIQYIDPAFFRLFVKPGIQLMMQDLTKLPAREAILNNAVVVTVGKSWASIHDDRLPHGDPGATVNAIPGAIGPIYFDESVTPNPKYTPHRSTAESHGSTFHTERMF